jgi:hypothetical protein
MVAVMIGLVLSVGVAVFGQQAGEKVSEKLHPNLAAAQQMIDGAINKLTEAQKANDYDMDGHAAHAKELLTQAYDEIKQAALAINAKKK